MVKNRTASLPQSECITEGLTACNNLFSVMLWLHWWRFFLSHRFHSERQSSSVCHPRLYISTCHDQQGEERHCAPVISSLWDFPNQWQVISYFINHIIWWGHIGELCITMTLSIIWLVFFCVTVGSARVQRRSLIPQGWPADQKNSCRLQCPPPPLTHPLQKVSNKYFHRKIPKKEQISSQFLHRTYGFMYLNINVFPTVRRCRLM